MAYTFELKTPDGDDAGTAAAAFNYSVEENRDSETIGKSWDESDERTPRKKLEGAREHATDAIKHAEKVMRDETRDALTRGSTEVCTGHRKPGRSRYLTHATMRASAWTRGSGCARQESNLRPFAPEAAAEVAAGCGRSQPCGFLAYRRRSNRVGFRPPVDILLT